MATRKQSTVITHPPLARFSKLPTLSTGSSHQPAILQFLGIGSRNPYKFQIDLFGVFAPYEATGRYLVQLHGQILSVDRSARPAKQECRVYGDFVIPKLVVPFLAHAKILHRRLLDCNDGAY